MDNRLYAIREFHDVIFTAGYDLKIGDTVIPEGDIIMSFSDVPKVNIREARTKVDAVGGYGNRSRVSWDETKGLFIDFSQGTVSLQHLAFLANSELQNEDGYLVPELEPLYSDDYGTIELKYKPNGLVTIYHSDNEKQRIETSDSTISGLQPQTFYNVHYHRLDKNTPTLKIGNRWITGYMRMTAKAKMKDDRDGSIRTMVIDLPKVQLLSELNMMLGSGNDAMSANFSIVAHPVGNRNDTNVGRLVFLGGE